MENEISWRGLALGLGAHLEALEAHCAVKTEKIGAEHAREGVELREAGRKLIALVKHAIEADPVSASHPDPVIDAAERAVLGLG